MECRCPNAGPAGPLRPHFLTPVTALSLAARTIEQRRDLAALLFAPPPLCLPGLKRCPGDTRTPGLSTPSGFMKFQIIPLMAQGPAAWELSPEPNLHIPPHGATATPASAGKSNSRLTGPMPENQGPSSARGGASSALADHHPLSLLGLQRLSTLTTSAPFSSGHHPGTCNTSPGEPLTPPGTP